MLLEFKVVKDIGARETARSSMNAKVFYRIGKRCVAEFSHLVCESEPSREHDFGFNR